MSRLLIGKFHSGSPTGKRRDGDVAHYNDRQLRFSPMATSTAQQLARPDPAPPSSSRQRCGETRAGTRLYLPQARPGVVEARGERQIWNAP